MSTLSLAVVSAIFVEFWGITALGFVAYSGKFFNFGALRKGPMGFLDFFVGLLEFVAELVRLLSFSFRLFGNMLAGEILLLAMTFLVAVASPILVIFYGLELFVGAVQAFVFGTLTLVFGVMAVSAHGPEDHEEAAHH
jgi:F-type H+-transporting ATPase subunit a